MFLIFYFWHNACTKQNVLKPLIKFSNNNINKKNYGKDNWN